jgi:EAL domain-containing protein (putative c-di-GMP-specific phosphodiesterase class I)
VRANLPGYALKIEVISCAIFTQFGDPMLSIADVFQDGQIRTPGEQQEDIVQDAVRAIRTHLGMDVAFLAEFDGDNRIYRKIDSDLSLPIAIGGITPLEETYCQRVVDGRLPGLISDTSLIPEAANLPVTKEFGIGAYLTSPIRLADGHVYGTLCCISFSADRSLGGRDIAALNLFGDFVGKQLDRTVAVSKAQEEIAAPVRDMLETGDFSTVYQPICALVGGRVAGFEALTRFGGARPRSPDLWFIDAAKAGLSEELEMAAIAKALKGLAHFPEDVYLSLNVSAVNILNGAAERILEGQPLRRIVLELTEHDSVEDYSAVSVALDALRHGGLRLAVDDAGAGYASFRHILKLKPDIIKLDISITRDIDVHVGRRALASALIRFSQETTCKVVAEGVETQGELAVLRELHVDSVQGYLISRPVPLEKAIALTAKESLVG